MSRASFLAHFGFIRLSHIVSGSVPGKIIKIVINRILILNQIAEII